MWINRKKFSNCKIIAKNSDDILATKTLPFLNMDLNIISHWITYFDDFLLMPV
jgi:hypothetical protein